jgi:hypothetical protein
VTPFAADEADPPNWRPASRSPISTGRRLLQPEHQTSSASPSAGNSPNVAKGIGFSR